MSKTLGVVIVIFLALVVGNILINMAAALLASNPISHAAGTSFGPIGETGSDGSSGVFAIHVSLFTKDGLGTSYVTQGYGRTPYSYLYPGDWHDGIDIGASYGEPVYSPNDGTVIAVGDQDNYCYKKAFGKYVAVRDPQNNLILWYAHLGTQTVSPGQTITKGAEIGTIGSTGLETGPHLHFSIFEADGFTMTPRDGCGPEPTGQDVDPLNYLGTIYQ